MTFEIAPIIRNHLTSSKTGRDLKINKVLCSNFRLAVYLTCNLILIKKIFVLAH